MNRRGFIKICHFVTIIGPYDTKVPNAMRLFCAILNISRIQFTHFTISFTPLKQNTLDQLLGEGLSLIRGLIDSHDGTIEMTSPNENRSSIHINMPVYSD